MKGNLARENIRKLKVNPHQSKDVQSQSPPHKKLLKKIEMIHKEPSHKYDLSLKENLLAREPPEEEAPVDFRVEIERRFKKTNHNQNYRFPRNGPNQRDSDSDSENTSQNSSFESLKHVTIYDLSSQNNKKKKGYQNKHSSRMAVTDDSKGLKSSSNYRNSDNARDTSTESGDWDSEERSGVPIELRIRDKSSATYKKLLGLLDKQLNIAHNKPNPNPDYVPLLQQQSQPKKAQQLDQEQKSKTAYNQPFLQESTSNRINTMEDDIEVHRLDQQKKKKERNIKSQGRHERTPYNFSEFLRPTKLTSSSGMQGVKKTPSQEKVGTRIETMPAMGSNSLEKTFGNLNASTTKG